MPRLGKLGRYPTILLSGVGILKNWSRESWKKPKTGERDNATDWNRSAVNCRRQNFFVPLVSRFVPFVPFLPFLSRFVSFVTRVLPPVMFVCFVPFRLCPDLCPLCCLCHYVFMSSCVPFVPFVPFVYSFVPFVLAQKTCRRSISQCVVVVLPPFCLVSGVFLSWDDPAQGWVLEGEIKRILLWLDVDRRKGT